MPLMLTQMSRIIPMTRQKYCNGDDDPEMCRIINKKSTTERYVSDMFQEYNNKEYNNKKYINEKSTTERHVSDPGSMLGFEFKCFKCFPYKCMSGGGGRLLWPTKSQNNQGQLYFVKFKLNQFDLILTTMTNQITKQSRCNFFHFTSPWY